jgi:nitroreductase
MKTITKLALGMMGASRPKPAPGDSAASISLPTAQKLGGMPLMEALSKRHSSREFASSALPMDVLSSLLWAAFGINRADGGRTAPSALNAQEIEIFLAMANGAYRYEASSHTLHLVAARDLRSITGYQDFVDDAPLVYVADHARMRMVPVTQRESYASVSAGAIAQNVYLFAASRNLSTVLRAWIDRSAIADALGLSHDEQVLLSQTIGLPPSAT